jgi:protein-L-isoaspartate(D-aspartate) O-methyltransferase
VSRSLARELESMGIRDPRVLDAVARVPRHLFVPEGLRLEAEADRPLPIGHGQTISQPFVVAYMTERLGLSGAESALEVGTGSGYQTALLALLAREVWSVEIVPELAERARGLLLGTMALGNVHLRVGDGSLGWPEAAPFDRILVAAAPDEVPPALVAQLAPGGRMILPVGAAAEVQMLRLVERGDDGVTTSRDLLPVRFVPLTHGGGGRGIG